MGSFVVLDNEFTGDEQTTKITAICSKKYEILFIFWQITDD